jgi:Putative peptidoglycan binding domain
VRLTVNMPDSIYPGNLPAGYGQYLAYCDGLYQTAGPVRAAHPQARVVVLTVFGDSLEADGADCEPGNVNAAGAAAWVKRKLGAQPASRPVVYADLESPGYSMSEVLVQLAAAGVARRQVRLLTAHYDGEHICGPSRGCRDATGNAISFAADGTQWSDAFPGLNGSMIDMSMLADDFFGGPTPPTTVNWTETLMRQFPELRQGATGTFVRTAQFQLGERGHKVAIDGAFGGDTLRALKACQAAARIAQDGVIGPVTWSALFGVQ